MTKSRSLFATVKGKDGRLRTFGGLTTDGVDDTTDAYDPVANKWTADASMASLGRYGLAATADASGNVYVVGGTPDGMTPTATVELYSPADDTWKSLADLPTARLGLGAATGKDGRIYTIGGRDTAGAPTDIVEVYSPATQTWSTAPSLPTKRLALVAVTGADGKIYAIGGRDAKNAPLGVVEAFDIDKGTWETAQPLLTARFWFGATLGADGRIYALGGMGDIGFLDDIEAFTPGAGWKALKPMPEARAWLSAGASADGQVFAIGGSAEPDGPGHAAAADAHDAELRYQDVDLAEVTWLHTAGSMWRTRPRVVPAHCAGEAPKRCRNMRAKRLGSEKPTESAASVTPHRPRRRSSAARSRRTSTR